jgi:hypothetical protein
LIQAQKATDPKRLDPDSTEWVLQNDVYHIHLYGLIIAKGTRSRAKGDTRSQANDVRLDMNAARLYACRVAEAGSSTPRAFPGAVGWVETQRGDWWAGRQCRPAED